MAFLKHPYESEIKSSVERRLKALGAHAGKAWGRSAVDVKGRIPKTHAGTERPKTIKGESAPIPSSGKVKHRADRPTHSRYAKGGKVKKGHHTTNIVIAQHPGGQQGPTPPVPVPVPVGGGPPMAPPMVRPPMAGPPMGPPVAGPPPGLAGGLPPPRPPGMARGGHLSGQYALSPEEHYENWGEGYKRGGHVKKKHAAGGFLGHEPPPGKTYKGYPHSPTTEVDDAVSPTKHGGHVKKHKHGGKVEHGDEKEDRKLFHKMMKEEHKHKRKHGGAVHGEYSGDTHRNWGRGLKGKGSDVNPGTGGKVDRGGPEVPRVSAPGASVHMDEGSGSGLGRLAKSKMPQTGRTSKTEM